MQEGVFTEVRTPRLGTSVSELDFITEEALSSFKSIAFFNGNNPNTYRQKQQKRSTEFG